MKTFATMSFVLALFGVAGQAIAQSSTAQIDSRTDVVAGNATAVQGNGNAQSITFAGGGGAPLVGTVPPQLVTPSIFGSLADGQGKLSVPLVGAYNRMCGLKYTRQHKPETIREDSTGSGQTRLVFSSHPNYSARKNSGTEVEEVTPPDFQTGEVKNAVCLGTLSVFTKENAGTKTDFSVVQDDAARFILENLRGFKSVRMVAIPQGVSYPSGVSSESSSFSLGAVASNLVSAATSGLINPHFARGGGNSMPGNWLGVTFILLALDEPEGRTIDTRELFALYGQGQQMNGTPPKNGATVPPEAIEASKGR